MLRRWDVETGRSLGRSKPTGLRLLAPLYETRKALACFDDGTVHVLRSGYDVPEKRLQGFDAPASALAVSPAGALALVGCRNGQILAWCLRSGKEVFSHALPGNGITAAAFIAEDLAILGLADGQAHALELLNGAHRCNLKGNAAVTFASAVGPGTALIGHSSGDLHIWDLDADHIRWTVPSQSGAVTSATYLAGSVQVLAGYEDGTVKVLDARDGAVLDQFQLHSGPVTGLLLAEPGTHVVSASSDRTICVLDAERGVARMCFGVDHAITGMAFSAERRWLCVLGDVQGSTCSPSTCSYHSFHRPLSNLGDCTEERSTSDRWSHHLPRCGRTAFDRHAPQGIAGGGARCRLAPAA